MADALDLLDKIRAKHDRLAEEQRANPRTEWPAGVILFECGDDGLPPRPADALDEAREGLKRPAVDEWGQKTSAAPVRREALEALCDELALLREYHEASETLETLLSNAMWTAEAQARLTAARTALAAWKAGR